MTDPDHTPGGPRVLLTALAWIVILLGDALAFWRGYVAVSLYRLGLQERLYDPPGSALYVHQARMAGLSALGALLLAGAGIALLLRAQRVSLRAEA